MSKHFVYSSEGKHFWHRNHAKLKKLNKLFSLIDAERGGSPLKVDTQGINEIVDKSKVKEEF